MSTQSSKIKRLICLPYAGGSCHFYNKWKKYLADDIMLYPIELAGRGRRIREAAYQTIDEVVEDMESMLLPVIDSGPYILFGHSMGSILSYELCYRFQVRGHSLPQKLIVSGRDALMYHDNAKQYHLMSSEELLTEMVRLGGVSETVASSQELMRLFLPIIRSDFAMLNQYHFRTDNERLNTDVLVMYGTEDEMIKHDINKWKLITNGGFEVIGFKGSHFYINNSEEEVVRAINQRCSDLA